MTKGKLIEIFTKYNIPDDCELLSDSGWECDPTGMNGVYYNEKENEMVFTQNGNEYRYFSNPDWILLYGEATDEKYEELEK